MREYEPEPGEARWSAWINRHPVIACTLTVALFVLGIYMAILRGKASAN